MTSMHARQPGDDGEFAAIVAGLSELDDLDSRRAGASELAHSDQPARATEVAPTSAAQAVVQPEPPAPPQRNEPTAPSPPNYWGSRGLVAVYWIAIITGAVGQVIFFGELFGIGPLGYLAAAIAATTSETIMVTAGDTAMQKRVDRCYRRQWVPFLAAAFAAAGTASGLNIAHWWAESASMAVLFGGIAGLGFLLHVMDGFTEGTRYLADLDTYETERARARHRADAHAEAIYERRLAAWETGQQATDRAVSKASTPQQPQQSRPARKGVPKSRDIAHSSGTPKLDADTARAWAAANGNATQAKVRAHFSARGYQVPSEATVRRWLNAH